MIPSNYCVLLVPLVVLKMTFDMTCLMELILIFFTCSKQVSSLMKIQSRIRLKAVPYRQSARRMKAMRILIFIKRGESCPDDEPAIRLLIPVT